MAKIIKKIEEELHGIKSDVPLKNYTTYKIGGPAKYFFVAKNKESLLKALNVAKKFKLPIFILGGGSNVLISDKGFKGLVIKIDILDINFNGEKVVVGAGDSITKLAYLSVDNGLSGLEWSAGMPGTVAGAIYGNAQAFGTKISSIIESVEAVNVKTLKLHNFTKKQCKFSLKNSVFKAHSQEWVIVSAVLKFEKGDTADMKNKIKEFLEYRRTKHPMSFPSAGSVFVNPEMKIKNKKLLEKFPELKLYNEQGIIPAGYLITKCGLAGKEKGNAQISAKHANFIINLGGASYKDVLTLINLSKKKVKSIFGINLEIEVQLIK